MAIDFVKMHGLGNDFMFIDDMENCIELTKDQVAHICDRHFGIGGDGVVLVRPSKREECAAYMHYINADGSLAQMCGNGVRCFAKFLVDRRIVDPTAGSFVADTLGGPHPIEFTVDDAGCLVQAVVDMGAPILAPQDVPCALEANADYAGVSYVREAELESPWGTYAFTCVSMGNPHAVCFLDDMQSLPAEAFVAEGNRSLDGFNLNAVGAFFESHAAFPEKANIEFAVCAADGIHMRVYERGDGETLACGTGACATNVAAALTGRAGRANTLHLRGGDLQISWLDGGVVEMTGPAAVVFAGSFDPADFE